MIKDELKESGIMLQISEIINLASRFSRLSVSLKETP